MYNLPGDSDSGQSSIFLQKGCLQSKNIFKNQSALPFFGMFFRLASIPSPMQQAALVLFGRSKARHAYVEDAFVIIHPLFYYKSIGEMIYHLFPMLPQK